MLHLAIIHEEETIAQQLIQLFPKEVLDIQNNLYQVSVDIVTLLFPAVCDFLPIGVFWLRRQQASRELLFLFISSLPPLAPPPLSLSPLPTPPRCQGSRCQRRLIRDFEWKLPSSTSCLNRTTLLVHPCMDVGGIERFQSHKAVSLSPTWSQLTGWWWGWRGYGQVWGLGATRCSVKEKLLKQRLSILLFDSVLPIFGVASHSEMSHLNVKRVVFLF